MYDNRRRDPDEGLVVLFRHHAQPNKAKSAAAGRPIADDMEVAEIRFPGSREVSVFPAHSQSDWTADPYSGTPVPRTYAERFPRQYEQFKAMTAQTKSGTPLEYVAFLTEARRYELRALNIYTVEALAIVDGQELKNLGQGGRELKNAAQDFLDRSDRLAPTTQLQAELEAARARAAILEEDNRALKERAASVPEERPDEFAGMSDLELKDFVAANTGVRPIGNPKRPTLLRMAQEARPDSHKVKAA